MKKKLFFAGAGGQGALAIGQMIAKAAMDEGLEVTWLPSYGPEMRGGTANCTVVVSDRPISCPLINDADVLVVMNLPSLTKFQSMVVPGGTLFINSSLVPETSNRDDIKVIEVPANEKASELGNERARKRLCATRSRRHSAAGRQNSCRRTWQRSSPIWTETAGR